MSLVAQFDEELTEILETINFWIVSFILPACVVYVLMMTSHQSLTCLKHEQSQIERIHVDI